MPDISSRRREARASLASASAQLKRRPNDPSAIEALRDAQRSYWALELEDHVLAVVEKAPPLTEAQRTRIATILAAVV